METKTITIQFTQQSLFFMACFELGRASSLDTTADEKELHKNNTLMLVRELNDQFLDEFTVVLEDFRANEEKYVKNADSIINKVVEEFKKL